jgi:hypothetical protein
MYRQPSGWALSYVRSPKSSKYYTNVRLCQALGGRRLPPGHPSGVTAGFCTFLYVASFLSDLLGFFPRK